MAKNPKENQNFSVKNQKFKKLNNIESMNTLKKFCTFLRCGSGFCVSFRSIWFCDCSEEFLVWFITWYALMRSPHNYLCSIVITICAINIPRDTWYTTKNTIFVVYKYDGVLHGTTACINRLPLNTSSAIITFIWVIDLKETINFNFSWND